jgi:hypothetical protein
MLVEATKTPDTLQEPKLFAQNEQYTWGKKKKKKHITKEKLTMLLISSLSEFVRSSEAPN